MLKLISKSQYNNLTFKSSENSYFLNKEKKNLDKIVLNIASLQTGWAYFALGMVPEFVWDDEAGKPGLQPSPDYKRCFSIKVIDEEDGSMDWSGAGYGSCAALEEIFGQIDTARKENPNKFPILQYLGSEPKKIGKGNTRVPKFNLLGWAAPDALPWIHVNSDVCEEESPF